MYKRQFLEQPIGNGPFYMDEPWKHNQYINLIKFEDYHGEAPKLDGVYCSIQKDVYKRQTDLTVRRSILHKVRNYLIVLPEQPDLEKALVLLGILERSGGLVQGVPRHVANRACCRRAFVRGSLIAGGFVADPRGDFHLEIAVQGEQFARDLADLIAGMGVRARVRCV